MARTLYRFVSTEPPTARDSDQAFIADGEELARRALPAAGRTTELPT